MMEGNHVKAVLAGYIAKEMLDGDGAELDEHAPLLEWGVIDSLSMVSLLAFIQEEFGITIPDAEVTPGNFQSISALAKLIGRRTEGHADA